MPASIAGLIASRLSEELFKPVLCVCNQEILSGSFRSPIDLNLALLIMQLRSEGVLLSGGGHKRAAGLSLRASQLPELRKRLQTIAVIVSRKYIPMPAMPFDELASYYSELEPYGAGSRAPFWGIPFYRSNVLPLYTRDGIGLTAESCIHPRESSPFSNASLPPGNPAASPLGKSTGMPTSNATFFASKTFYNTRRKRN